MYVAPEVGYAALTTVAAPGGAILGGIGAGALVGALIPTALVRVVPTITRRGRESASRCAGDIPVWPSPAQPYSALSAQTTSSVRNLGQRRFEIMLDDHRPNPILTV